MTKHKKDEYKCPLEATMDIIGGKYKGVIIGHLINKTLRYNELQKLISHATPKMLIQQLKELETDGIIKRKLYPVRFLEAILKRVFRLTVKVPERSWLTILGDR